MLRYMPLKAVLVGLRLGPDRAVGWGCCVVIGDCDRRDASLHLRVV